MVIQYTVIIYSYSSLHKETEVSEVVTEVTALGNHSVKAVFQASDWPASSSSSYLRGFMFASLPVDLACSSQHFSAALHFLLVEDFCL